MSIRWQTEKQENLPKIKRNKLLMDTIWMNLETTG